MRRVELALLLRVLRLYRERLEVVFIDASDEVALGEVAVRDLADFVNDLLEVVRGNCRVGKDLLRERALQSRVVRLKTIDHRIEVDIELVVGGMARYRLPAAFRRKEEATLRSIARRMVELLVVESALCADSLKLLLDFLTTHIELLADEPKEHKRQHQVALVRDTRLAAQKVAAVEKNVLKSQFLGLRRFLHSHTQTNASALNRRGDRLACMKRAHASFMHSSKARPKARSENMKRQCAQQDASSLTCRSELNIGRILLERRVALMLH